MKRTLLLLLLAVATAANAQTRLPIVDMHLHAKTANELGPPPVAICVPFYPQFPSHDPRTPFEDAFAREFRKPSCAAPMWSPRTDEAMIRDTVAVLERRNVIAVLSGPLTLLPKWHAAAPDRFIRSLELEIDGRQLSPEGARQIFRDGRASVLGEVTNQYLGIAPDDERMRPYWAMAEELDIPVGIHMGEGPPGAAFLFPKYRVRLSNPLLLEEVLVRHPRLRVFVMHYGTPFIDEMIAMLQAFPNLYVETGGLQWGYPRQYFYSQLKQMVDAGFGKRIMFGSDQISWPGLVEYSIAVIEGAPFLSEQQKRDILYNNAARFLRFTPAQIAEHHALGEPRRR